MKSLLAIASLVLALAAPAAALEIEGVKLEDRAKIGAAEVPLNGAGLRTRLGFKVYAAGLYLGEKTKDPGAAIAAAGPKRIAIHMMRDVGGKTFLDSLNEGLEKNTPAPELAKLKLQVDQLTATMQAVGDVKKGDVILLDFVPGAGMQITVNGQLRGKPIEGDDFSRAMLRIWLGEKPADGDLKKGMLAQG